MTIEEQNTAITYINNILAQKGLSNGYKCVASGDSVTIIPVVPTKEDLGYTLDELITKSKEIHDNQSDSETNPETPVDSSGNTVDASKQDGVSEDDVSEQDQEEKDNAANEVVDEVVESKNDSDTSTASIQGDSGQSATDMTFMKAWDPRLKRLDEFLYNSTTADGTEMGIRIPFASNTIATAFANQVYKLEKIAALRMLKDNPTKMESYDIGHLVNKDDIIEQTQKNEKGETTSVQVSLNGNDATTQQIKNMKDTDKIFLSRTADFRANYSNYGVQSIMNPFSLTKLMGGLSAISDSTALNYMYDIRDRRRYYDVTVDQTANDTLTISNPTVSNIIHWSNQDKWGRTPYSWQDFVYNKFFGVIPNNRLITFRRYANPCSDNLTFENMWGDIENPVKDADGLNTAQSSVNSISDTPKGMFPPIATVVSYFGGQTGNKLSNFFNFATGINWQDFKSDLHNVSGDDGTNPQMEIDKIFENGGYQPVEFKFLDKAFTSLSTQTSKILSFGKFSLASNGTVGQSEEVMNKTYNVQEDPYGSGGPYEHRILGPINRIDQIKARKEGIVFEQSFTLKVTYQAKAIGGINPKAALLDCMANAQQMVSPNAVFWGGGYNYNITPHTYPFHDGGWRDSFMKKIYDGNFLGKNGAIAVLGSGIKKFAGVDERGEINLGNLTGQIGGGIGQIMGAIASGLSALGSSISFGGLSDVLKSASNFISGAGTKVGGEESVNAGKTKLGNLTKNLASMWHDRCLQQTTFPQIHGMGALLTGEPVGDWHLTIGNPLNPIMVIGNLICSKVSFECNDEIGPDDFPTEVTATYTIEHGMARDKSGIQSMFNRGMGRYYILPDYMKASSDLETKVDKHTGGSEGMTGRLKWMSPAAVKRANAGEMNTGKNIRDVKGGSALKNSGNPNTMLVTSFTPPNTNANMTLADIRSNTFVTTSNMTRIKSLAATRKMVE